MAKQPIPVNAGQFKSFLIPATAVFYTLSALLAVAGIALLFDGDYAALLIQDRIDGGIALMSSLKTWQWIDTGITVLSFLCPALMAVGLGILLRGRITAGMKWVTALFQGLLWALYISSAAVLACYVFKMLGCILVYLRYNEGVYLIYSLLITEGLMGVQAWLIWLALRKFLRESGDCAYSITYTLTAGKLDTLSIPSFPSLGLAILGCVQLVLAWDKVFTLMLVENYVQNYYKLLIATHPGQYLAAATLVTGAIGNFLLSLYLRRYNRICERIRFQANRLT